MTNNLSDAGKFFAANPDIIKEETKKQKHLFTNMDIVCPKITSEEVLRNQICHYPINPDVSFNMIWSKFPYRQASIYHNKIKSIYECERGSLFGETSYKNVFLFCFNLKKEQMKNTDKWVVVGGFATDQIDLIDFIWVHPFLRGMGLTTMFLQEYIQHENPLILLPPLSGAMQGCLKKLNEVKDKEILQRVYATSKRYHIKRYELSKEKVDKLTDQHYLEFISGMGDIHAGFASEGLGSDAIKDEKGLFNVLLDYHLKLQENPELREQAEEWARAHVDIDKFLQRRKDMMDFGIQTWNKK